MYTLCYNKCVISYSVNNEVCDLFSEARKLCEPKHLTVNPQKVNFAVHGLGNLVYLC